MAKEMSPKEAWTAVVQAIHDACHEKVYGWHEHRVACDLTGLLEAPVEEQFRFVKSRAVRGTDRVNQERISAVAVQTAEQARAILTYANALQYVPGTRVGAARIVDLESAKRSLYLKAFAKHLKDKGAKAVELANKYGITLTEAGRLEGTGDSDFQAYITSVTATEAWNAKGAAELARVEAERAARTAAKKADEDEL